MQWHTANGRKREQICLNKKHRFLSSLEVLVGWAAPVLAAWGNVALFCWLTSWLIRWNRPHTNFEQKGYASRPNAAISRRKSRSRRWPKKRMRSALWVGLSIRQG